jgi:dolichyl-phosphate-mannose-protein mannosyltransferase
VRWYFIQSQGFTTDIGTFEAWAIALAEHGLWSFYNNGSFADYPPGYCYILVVVGWIWETFFRATDANQTALVALVKMPAILADLGIGALLYGIARRFAGEWIAIGTCALYLLNPAIIFNSAIYGQVDSVSAGVALLAVFLLLKSDDPGSRPGVYVVLAWATLSFSLLIKPQAAVLIPLFSAYAFTGGGDRQARTVATVAGIAAAFVVAIVLAEPFHPSNPVEAIHWLLGRFAFGSNVYPYNSVNAFNLWAVRGAMWQSDSTPMIGVPLYFWGIGLVIVSVVAVVWRYLQERTPRAFLEGCAIATLGFFIFATRMHERYIFDGVMFAIVCVPLAWRYATAAVLLSVVLYANLQYSLAYLYDASNHIANINGANIWGWPTVAFAALATGVFFWLAYAFLGPASSLSPSGERADAQDDAIEVI